jgi:DNA-directed RNA polymerase subunit RPC12/RpoP
MVKRGFVCVRCEKTFILEVLEPGEAKDKKIRPVPISCPQCGGPLIPAN